VNGELGEPILTDEALFDARGYVVEQEHATSSDGTRIPYFLVRRTDLEFDGTSPTLVYAYGGFGLAMLPSYVGAIGGGDVLVPWFNAGGTFVLANLRGGGEFGPDWHQAAVLSNRQTAYDDFYAVAERLIETGVTSPEHLGIKGESNGGLPVSVALTQRPDLFSAVLCGVPLTDMLNYHTMLAGASWMGEYGNPQDPEMRSVLEAYSPFHNVDADADYPEAFFYTSTADDRVHPGHARKMVAKLQAVGHPVLYYENTEGGHGATATPEQAAELTAMQAVYLMEKLGLEGLEQRQDSIFPSTMAPPPATRGSWL
jgi:prolyl oligopeptidase